MNYKFCWNCAHHKKGWSQSPCLECLKERGTKDRYPKFIHKDDTWTMILDDIRRDAAKADMTDMDVFVVWQIGKDAFKLAKKLGMKFPHER